MKRKVAITCFLGALFFGVSTVDVVKADLLWHLEFEDNVLDTAGHPTGPYDGTILGAGIGGYVDGKVGRAVLFDGSETRVDLPGTPSSLSEWTLLFWLNSEAEWFDELYNILNVPIWGGDGCFAFGTMLEQYDLWIPVGKGGLNTAEDTFSAPNDVGVWIHMAVSWSNVSEANETKLYVNGVLMDSQGVDVGDPNIEWDRGTNIGAWDYSDTEHYAGITEAAIDDARLYDEVLEQAEIVAIMNFVPVVTIVQTDAKTAIGEKATENFPTSDTYTIELNSQPDANVDCNLVPTSGGLDFKINAAEPNVPVTLVFTPDDWNSPQTVTVTAVDDDLEEGLEFGFIVTQLSSTDANFNGKLVQVIRIDIDDDDAAQVETVETDGSTQVSEAGATDEFKLFLNKVPTDDVTVTLSEDKSDPNDPNQLNFVPDTVTFTPAEVSAGTRKTITVSAVDDPNLENDPHVTTVGFGVTSADLEYEGIAVSPVNVAILENECGAWGFDTGDINQDCEVSMYDLLEFALEFLKCTHPNVEGCTDYR